MTRQEREGFIWIILAAAGFSAMPSLVKITYLHSMLEPMDIAIWRFIVAVPVMWVMVVYRRRSASLSRKSDAPVKQVLLIGVMISAAVLAAFFALERLPASTYIVLFYTYPAMVVLLSAALGERIGYRAWLALTMALAGVVLTVPNFFGVSVGDWLGVLLVLGNAVIVAIYYILSKRALNGVVDLSGSSAWMMLGTLLVMLLLIPLRGLQLPQNPQTLVTLVGIAVLGTVLPVFAINIAIQRIGAARASLVSTVEPPLSMVMSMAILGEAIFAIQWLGAALIVGSVIALQFRPRNRIDVSIAHEAG
ncbi:MAG: DMT family transporter [Chloroflexi bacterium]|nr:DMT family transporter [Chloroflexota bacterium]